MSCFYLLGCLGVEEAFGLLGLVDLTQSDRSRQRWGCSACIWSIAMIAAKGKTRCSKTVAVPSRRESYSSVSGGDAAGGDGFDDYAAGLFWIEGTFAR